MSEKKLRAGDNVLVKGTVAFVDDAHSQVVFGSTDNFVYVAHGDIHSVLPAPLAVGERVTWGHGSITYRIAHIECGYAMLVDGINKGETWSGSCSIELSELRRV